MDNVIDLDEYRKKRTDRNAELKRLAAEEIDSFVLSEYSLQELTDWLDIHGYGNDK